MRAIYLETSSLEQFSKGHSLFIEGGQAHHLLNVIRVKSGDEIMLLDGNGLVAMGEIKQCHKRKIEVNILSIEKKDKRNLIDLAIGIPKKEALEDIFKFGVEIGLNKIYLLKSDYSQFDYNSKHRQEKILASALIQSNNPFFPEISKLSTIEDLGPLFINYKSIAYFCSKSIENLKKDQFQAPTLIIIGPEAGFSLREEKWLQENKKISCIHLPTYILRSPQAVCVASGYTLGKLK